MGFIYSLMKAAARCRSCLIQSSDLLLVTLSKNLPRFTYIVIQTFTEPLWLYIRVLVLALPLQLQAIEYVYKQMQCKGNMDGQPVDEY